MKNRLVIIFLLMMLFLSGCKSDGENTRVVLTTGFSKNEIFRIENKSCTLPEVMVFLTNIQNRYESVFGEEIWSASTDGMTLEEDVKDTVLAQLAQSVPAQIAGVLRVSVQYHDLHSVLLLVIKNFNEWAVS